MATCEHPTASVIGGETWQRCLRCQTQRERPAPPIGHGEWGEWTPLPNPLHSGSTSE
jgi:hypothetical protein